MNRFSISLVFTASYSVGLLTIGFILLNQNLQKMNFKFPLRYELLTACLLLLTTFGWSQSEPIPCTLGFTTNTVGVFCNESTGSIEISISGGTAPFTIDWAGAEDSQWMRVLPNRKNYTLSGLAPGIYNFIVRDAFGCQQKAEVCLKNQVSTMELMLSNNSTACDVEGSISVVVKNSSPPYWVVLDGPIKPIGFHSNSSTFNLNKLSVSGTYTVTVRKGECEQTATINVIVSEAGPLALDVTAAEGVLRGVNTSITGGHAPYRLYYEGLTYGLTNGLTHSDGEKLIQNLAPGNYRFTVIDSEMCQVKMNFRIRNSKRVATINAGSTKATIGEKTMAIHKVFPNPVSNLINFSFSTADQETVTVSVKDLLGRTLVQQQASNFTERGTIDVSNLSNGVYYLELNNGKNLVTKKFVKK